MIKTKLFLILIILTALANATNIDSLKQELRNETDNYNIIIYNIELSEILLYNSPDSAAKYATNAIYKCTEEKNDTLKYQALSLLGYSLELTGKLDSAEKVYKETLVLAIHLNDVVLQGVSNSSIGNIAYYKGEYNKSLRYYQIALGIAEKQKDTFSIGQNYHNIGLIHDDIGNRVRGLEYYNYALKIFIEVDDKEWLATCYNSIASIYVNTQEYTTAQNYYNKSINNFKLANDNNGLGMVYSNIGELKLLQNQINSAEEYFTKSIEISKSVNDIISIVNSYLNMSELLNNQKIHYKALEYATKALKYAKKGNYLIYQEASYEILKDINFKLGNYKASVLYADSIKLMGDSIFNKDKFESIEEMESKYQTVKKQLQINNLEKGKELRTEKIEKQNIYIYSFIIGLILVLIFLAFIFRLLKIKQKNNKELEFQRNTILENNEELNQLVEEVTAQKDEIEMQRENLVDINSDITNSISYAQQIQKSILPDEKLLKTNLTDSFILYKPKDIVSGDFYWFTKLENKLIITVVDCTGHGVPGAFMSMLGASLLREIIVKEKLTIPGEILDILRTEVISALQQNGTIGEQKDGMDMSIISLDLDTNIMQYAGANNSLYLITNSELSISNEDINSFYKLYHPDIKNDNSKLLYELKPDKMPISHFIKMNNFSTQSIKLEKGDSIYLFTDGYPDQFGGIKNRKFKYKPFKNMLISNSTKAMNVQKELLEQSLNNWQGNNQQVDDISVLGIKI